MTHIPAALRRLAYDRAQGRCEYCGIHYEDVYQTHEVDHIYAEKHAGQTIEVNVALSCHFCNRHKGTDLASLDPLTGDVVRLYHPRFDQWHEHFKHSRARIEPLTAIGRVTASLLHFNDSERLIERHLLIILGRYPGTS
jgi:5-methylcytosine-specific restriction endonuclease McrA